MQKTKLPNPVAIMVLTLITVVMWVGFTIYNAVSKKPEAPVPAPISKPLTPTLDVETINKIESRIYLDDSQISDNVVTGPVLLETTAPVATPIPTTPETSLSPIPEASSEPQPSPST